MIGAKAEPTETPNQVFRATRIKLRDGGRLLLRVSGKQTAEFEIPPRSTVIILRRKKKRGPSSD